MATVSATTLPYVGNELDVFADARVWKSYLGARMRPFIGGRVLEVGAGLGANIPHLHHSNVIEWCSLEPDPELAEQFRERQLAGKVPSDCRLVNGILADLPPIERFDTILYIDVLEHIADDRREFASAFQRLTDGGHLIILCPAHPFLFSQLDTALGHFRRYTARAYRALSSHQPIRIEYLDAVGMLASLMNRIALKQPQASRGQMLLWDRCLVRASRVVDVLTARRLGKSILGVWRKPRSA